MNLVCLIWLHVYRNKLPGCVQLISKKGYNFYTNSDKLHSLLLPNKYAIRQAIGYTRLVKGHQFEPTS